MSSFIPSSSAQSGIDEIKARISDLSKDLEKFAPEHRSQVMVTRLRQEKLRAMMSLAKAQHFLAEMDVLIADYNLQAVVEEFEVLKKEGISNSTEWQPPVNSWSKSEMEERLPTSSECSASCGKPKGVWRYVPLPVTTPDYPTSKEKVAEFASNPNTQNAESHESNNVRKANTHIPLFFKSIRGSEFTSKNDETALQINKPTSKVTASNDKARATSQSKTNETASKNKTYETSKGKSRTETTTSMGKSKTNEITSENKGNETTSKGKSNERTSKDETNVTMSNGKSNKRTSKDKTYGTTSKGKTNEKTSKDNTNETTSRDKSNETTSRDKTNETTSRDKTNETISRDKTNETTSKGKTTETTSKDKRYGTTSKGKTNEKTSKDNTNETTFRDKTDETISRDKTNKTASRVKTNETASRDKTNETTSKGKTTETTSKGKTHEKTSRGKTYETTSKDKTTETTSRDKTNETTTRDKTKETTSKDKCNETTSREKNNETLTSKSKNNAATSAQIMESTDTAEIADLPHHGTKRKKHSKSKSNESKRHKSCHVHHGNCDSLKDNLSDRQKSLLNTSISPIKKINEAVQTDSQTAYKEVQTDGTTSKHESSQTDAVKTIESSVQTHHVRVVHMGNQTMREISPDFDDDETLVLDTVPVQHSHSTAISLSKALQLIMGKKTPTRDPLDVSEVLNRSAVLEKVELQIEDEPNNGAEKAKECLSDLKTEPKDSDTPMDVPNTSTEILVNGLYKDIMDAKEKEARNNMKLQSKGKITRRVLWRILDQC